MHFGPHTFFLVTSSYVAQRDRHFMVLDLDYVMDAAALSAFLTRPVFGLK
jgi:hypothetical protein